MRQLPLPMTNSVFCAGQVPRQTGLTLGWGFAETLMSKMAAAVTPLGISPPETRDSKIVYIMGNTSCEPKPGDWQLLPCMLLS